MYDLLENKIVFTNLNGIYIIKCECLDILKYYSNYQIYSIDLATYCCDKVRIIELYDINKNIIDHIIDPIYNDPLKIDSIISLESFKEDVFVKKNHYFKTFTRAYIERNKINNIQYDIIDTGEIFGLNNDTVQFRFFDDFLKLNGFNYYTIFYDNDKVSHCIDCNNNCFNITYYLYNKSYKYKIKIYRDTIEIIKIFIDINYRQILICNKELKILQALEQNSSNVLYEENRDINDVIIDIKKYNPNTNKLETILSNNDNKFILIESEKSFPKELLYLYNSEINYIDSLISIRNNEFDNAKNTLLNEIFKEL